MYEILEQINDFMKSDKTEMVLEIKSLELKKLIQRKFLNKYKGMKIYFNHVKTQPWVEIKKNAKYSPDEIPLFEIE